MPKIREKHSIFIEFIKQLCEKRYTGQLRLNFHEGNLSEKIEKKESIKLLDDVMLTCARIKRDEIIKDILISPPQKRKEKDDSN